MAQNKKVNVEINLKDRASTGMQKFKRALLSVKGAILSGIGLVALNKLLKQTVGRAQSAESGLKRLAVAMKSAGRFTTENAKSFERLAVALEKQTGFQEEQILEALSVLQTFGRMTRADMEKTIVASLNMATIFNEDLTQAAIRLGKAYNGQLIGLQRMGVKISKATFNAEGFSAVLKQLATEQGGQAVARMAGFEGSILRVAVGFGEVGKEVGKFITKSEGIKTTLDSMGGGLQIVSGWLRKFREENKLASDVTKEHADEMERIRNATSGATAETSLMVSKITDLIKVSKEIAARKNDLRLAYDPQFIAQTRKQIRELTKEQSDLTDELARLNKDPVVSGSKAHQALMEQKRKEKKILEEETKVIEQANDAWVEMQDSAKAVTAQTERFVDLQDRRKDIADRNKTAEDALIKTQIEGLKEIGEAERKKAEEEQELLQAKIINAIDADERLTAIEKEAAEKRVRTILESTERIDEIERKAARKRMRIASSIAQNEIAAQQRLVQKLADMRSGEAADQLKDDTLNVTERKVLMQELVEEAERLTKEVADASSAQELETAINALEKFKSGLAGTKDAEDLFDAIKEGAKVAITQVELLGRAKFSPDIDVEGLNLKMKTSGGRAYDEWKRGFDEQARKNPISLPRVDLTLKSGFVNNGG